MRYHWGLTVGHVYTHGETASKMTNLESTSTPHSVGLDLHAMPIASGSAATLDLDILQEDGSNVEQLAADDDELEYLDLADDDELEYLDLADEPEDEGPDDFSDDDMVVAMEEMYAAGSNNW